MGNMTENFEITDQELDVLENGSKSSIFLNFALLLLSISTCFLVMLIFTTIPSDRVFAVITIIVVIGYLADAALFVLWRISRKSTAGVAEKVRSRTSLNDSYGETPDLEDLGRKAYSKWNKNKDYTLNEHTIEIARKEQLNCSQIKKVVEFANVAAFLHRLNTSLDEDTHISFDKNVLADPVWVLHELNSITQH